MNPLDIISGISRRKRTAEAALQAFGRKIRKNIDQGQKDYQAGKIGYGSINIFK